MRFLDRFRKDDEPVTKNISRDLLDDMSEERLRAFVFAMEAEIADLVRQGEAVFEEFVRREMDIPETMLSTIVEQRRHGDDDDDAKKQKKVADSSDAAAAEAATATALAADAAKADAILASVIVPPVGPQCAKVAFVGASPSVVDAIRGEPFCGPPGRTLKMSYLSKIGLERDDVLLMDVVPKLLQDEGGKAREPTPTEITEWMPWVKAQLAEFAPGQVIALGTTARNALEELADEWLPHPVAVRAHGERYEVTRKLGRVKRAIDDELALVEIKGTVIKADGEQQLVTGIVAEPESVDTHGDKISAREIQNAAHRFLIKSRIAGDQHSKAAPARVVESYIVPTDQIIESQTVEKGTWVITMKVVDPEFWARVKKGDFTGFSLGGFAKRIPALA